MKKLYIFFGQSILGNGGGQIYLLNKKKYLESLGYNVVIFSYHTNGKILYNEFNEYKKNIFPEFEFSLNFFKTSYIKTILNKVLSKIKPLENHEIIVESNWIGSSEWAELLSSKIKAKHVIYLLSEHNYAEYSLDFLLYKHERKEISAISEIVIKEVFNKINNFCLNDFSVISAGCFSLSNPQNLPYRKFEIILNKANADYVISYFGRLEKLKPKYISEIINISNKYPSKKFLFVALGYNSEFEIKKFNSIISLKPNNLEINFFETVTIVPKFFFDLSNVVIASAGSAVISALNDKITISMDVNTDFPIGILGINTKETTFSHIQLNISLSKVLEDVLIYRKYSSKNIDMSHIKSIHEKSKKKFIDFIRLSNKKYYYDFRTRSNNFRFSKSEIRRILIRLIGIKNVILYRKIRYNK